MDCSMVQSQGALDQGAAGKADQVQAAHADVDAVGEGEDRLVRCCQACEQPCAMRAAAQPDVPASAEGQIGKMQAR